ncbi:type II secretion system protein N [Comamonas humi]
MSRRARSPFPAAHSGTPPWRWAATGALLGGAAAALLWAPAHWLAGAVAWASQGQLQFVEPRGTVWNGSAQWVLTGGAHSRDRMALPGRVQWQLRPSWSGALLRWHADCCMREPLAMAIAPRWGGATLSLPAHESQWPASLLTGLGTPWNTMEPQGQLRLRSSGLQLQLNAGRLQLSGEATLEALAVTSRLSTVRPLGSYQALLQGGDMASLSVKTLQGPFFVQGSGQWVGQRLRFTGEAWAAEGSEAALGNLLNIIGQRRGTRSLLSVG